MPTDPAQLFINTNNDPGLIVGPRVDADGALRYPTSEPQSSNTIVNIIQYNLNTIGANNQVLINKDNVATGDAELTYDANTNILTTETLNVGNLITAFSANLGNVANVKITGGSNGYVLKTDGSGNLTWASQTVATPTWSSITGKPTFATVATSGDYNDLSNKPTGGATTTYVDNKVANVTWANLSGAPTLANVATSGSYADLSNLPNLMGVALSGNYNDLSNRPSIPSIEGLASETYVDNKIANVTYANLSDTPTFATVATSGLYADLTYPTYVAENNLPDAANNAGMFAYVSQTGHGYVSNSTSWVKLGNFDDLPDLTNYALASSVPAAQIQSDWTQTDDEQKDYIKNKPALFSGEYSDLANKPGLFSGSYADLTNKPTIPTNLDSLSNVTITSASNGQVLKFDGSNWVNDTLTAGNPFDQDLNTSNSVEFANIYLTGNITSDTALAIYTETGSGSNIDIRTDWAGNGTTGGIQVLLKHGTGLDIKTDDGDHVWSFDNTGNLTLPTNTSKINYANGTSILSGLSGLGGGANTGNMTFSGDNITGSDGVVRIRSLDTTTTASYNFTPVVGDYSTAVWDGQGITFNDPTQPIYDAIFALTNLSAIQVQVAGNWFTVTSSGSSTPGMPQAPTLFVNETAVSGPLNIDVVDIEIIEGTESYAEIDGSDFRVDVQDDIRIYGNDTFLLYNKSTTDSIQIETNDGDHTWEFNASGDLILPLGGDILDSTGTSVLGTGTLDSVTDSGSTTTNSITVGSISLTNGSTITETANTTVITPPGALAGQSLVIRLTGAQGIVSDHPGGFADGDTITLTVTPDVATAPVTGTVDYTFTGCTSVELGRALTGTLEFTTESAKPISWTIPVSSTITTFTITLSNASGFDISGISPLTLTKTGSSEDHHIHLIASDPSITDIYLGDDDQYVKIEKNGGNVIIGTDTNSRRWTFDTNGNLTLPANTFAVNYANGTQVSLGTGGGASLPLSNGNSIINIASVDGNITLDADGNVFTLGIDGNLTTPTNLVIGPRPGGGSSISQNDAALDITGEGSTAGVQLGWAANLSQPDSVALIAMNSIVGEGSGNVLIAVGNNATTVHSWLFGNNGNLKLPAGGDILDSTGSSIIPDVSGFVTGTPWTSEGYLTSSDLSGYALSSSVPAAQIQSDWTQETNTALDFIKNKPTLFSGDYDDLTDKPTSIQTVSAGSGPGGNDQANSLVLAGLNPVSNIPSTYGGDIILQPGAGGSNGDLYGEVRIKSGTVGSSYEWHFTSDKKIKLPQGGDIVDSTGTSVLGGGGIALTDLSVGEPDVPSSYGDISYNNTTGVFTYTPPVIPDVSGFALSSAIPTDVSNLTDTTSLLSGAAYQFKSANFNVSVKQTYLVSTTAGAITATLPASPATGDWFVVYDFDQNFPANNLTLDGNGKNVRYWDLMGSPAGWTAGSATLAINQSYAGPVGTTAQRFVYNGTVWSRIA